LNDSNQKVEGFLHACRYETLHRPGGWDVISLAVLPEAQGSGVGTELLTHFEDEARRLGGTYVRLNSRVERTAAHAFYEHRGYLCDKTQKRFIKQFDL
jgi:ribosomal protein S18 acetylase RimI-like enzyme